MKDRRLSGSKPRPMDAFRYARRVIAFTLNDKEGFGLIRLVSGKSGGGRPIFDAGEMGSERRG